ncbi:MAG: NlpC/P60 family protein [Campylobacterota bacterium]|nr:NlpC/P60 family protein [Campylobacterota bacterium]
MKKLSKLLLVLSFTTATMNAATTTIKYKAKSGDSLYSIAKENHTTVTKLRQVNRMKKGDILKVGKVLKVPTNKKSSPKLSKYRIKKGDNLSSIAKRHHTTIEKLTTINSMKRSDILKLGHTIKVPKTTYRLAKKKKPSGKKLVASLSNLDTVSLKSTKRSHKPTLSDIFNTKKTSNLAKSKKIETVAKKKLGKRYVWGASGTKNTYDCSSFTKYVYRKNGISIPRTSINQSKHGKYVKRKDLKKGDLIFFDTSKRRKGYVNHVGIYLGDNKFIHASSAKKKVVITSLDKNFYSRRYKGARRPS